MKRMKLTLAGRIVAFVLVAAIVVGGVVAGYKFLAPSSLIDNFGSETLGSYDDGDVINLSLDEWIG